MRNIALAPAVNYDCLFDISLRGMFSFDDFELFLEVVCAIFKHCHGGQNHDDSADDIQGNNCGTSKRQMNILVKVKVVGDFVQDGEATITEHRGQGHEEHLKSKDGCEDLVREPKHGGVSDGEGDEGGSEVDEGHCEGVFVGPAPGRGARCGNDEQGLVVGLCDVDAALHVTHVGSLRHEQEVHVTGPHSIWKKSIEQVSDLWIK